MATVIAVAVFAPGALAIADATAPIPVIIDTDIGDDIDDAFALALAVGDSRLEVVGITTSWGDTRTRVLLVRRLLAALGRSDIPVAQGPSTPNSTPFTQRQWAERATDVSSAPDAVEFIRSAVEKRRADITLVALAPLTTLEALLAKYPQTVRNLRQVVMMGGSIRSGYFAGGAIPGTLPSAEYNVASRPRALAKLLTSGVPIKMFPLDSTQIKFDEVRRDRLFAHGSAATDALTQLYYQWRVGNSWGQLTPTLFDLVPVAWLLEPGACPVEPLRIEVDDRGYTRPVVGAPNLEACLEAKESSIQRLMIDTVAPAPTSNPR